MSDLMTIRDLSICYGDGQAVLKNISFDIKHSEVISIVGESGSGKSTLIRALMNILPGAGCIESGDIALEGQALDMHNEKEWRQIRGKDLAMIFQTPASYFNPILKIRSQFIRTIRSHKSITRKEAEGQALLFLEKMGLDDPKRVLQSYPFQLSGGMIQRVAIAMAMAMYPKILFADEPTSALDVLTQEQIMVELRKLCDEIGTSVVMVTHNMGCAAYVSDRIMVMKNGQIEEIGYTDKVLKTPSSQYTKTLLSAVPKLKGRAV